MTRADLIEIIITTAVAVMSLAVFAKAGGLEQVL